MRKILTTLTVAPFLLASALTVAGGPIDWRDYDNDGNKKLTIEEFSQLRITQYAKFDRNSDGIWSRKEFVKRSNNMTMARTDALRKKFNKWDANDDAELNSEEVAKLIAGNFRWLDKNKSRSLSLKEMPKRF
tara:strand:+ start:298 stop:693 length:396 start_codon:yes stop_codon:yes gene_type:complete